MSDPTATVNRPDPNESHKPDILACAIVVMALAVFFVGLRFYSRAGILKGLKGDDWFILVALVKPSWTFCFQVGFSHLALGSG
jgi:hypothetical protein